MNSKKGLVAIMLLLIAGAAGLFLACSGMDENRGGKGGADSGVTGLAMQIYFPKTLSQNYQQEMIIQASVQDFGHIVIKVYREDNFEVPILNDHKGEIDISGDTRQVPIALDNSYLLPHHDGTCLLRFYIVVCNARGCNIVMLKKITGLMPIIINKPDNPVQILMEINPYPLNFCFDLDKDGFGVGNCPKEGSDCNDLNAAVNLEATEGPQGNATCKDSLDNDCDGAPDVYDTACDFDVSIQDPNLETVIRDALEEPTEPVKASDLYGLTILNAASSGISEITELEYCVNLTGLNLTDNLITDIGALAGLTALKGLGLEGNSITDISALVANAEYGGLGAGDYVSLRGNPLETVSCDTYIPELLNYGVTLYYDECP